jgi:hypothetical protein
MPIKTSSAKAKGRKFQQYIRDLITTFFFLKEGDVESRSMGAAGVDIMLSPVARERFPVSIEAKKTKKTPSRAELEQAKANAYPGTVPAVVWCPHGSGPDKSVIMFDLQEFLTWFVHLPGHFTNTGEQKETE